MRSQHFRARRNTQLLSLLRRFHQSTNGLRQGSRTARRYDQAVATIFNQLGRARVGRHYYRQACCHCLEYHRRKEYS